MTQMTRWNPLREMETIHHQMNRLFEPFFVRGGLDEGTDLAAGAWVPPVDIEETSDRLVVRAEIPGMSPDEIDVRVENGVLTIRGERRFESERRDRNFHRVERSYGTFSRSFTLPTTVDTENVSARYEQGILELEMPRREEAKPRRIPIANQNRTLESSAERK